MALMCAAGNGHTSCINMLIDNGADVNTEGFLGQTALSEAASHGHLICMKPLLDKGADVNKAVLKAARGGHFSCQSLHLNH